MDKRFNSRDGKIKAASPHDMLRLLSYSEKYPSELAADLRRFYGISLFDIGSSVSWQEAILLVTQLMKNPESFLYSCIAETDGPYSKTDTILMDLFDLTVWTNTEKGKKPTRYKRPWDKIKKVGKGTLPLSVASEFFARLGHKPSSK